jgi:hypothetical protein
MRGKTAMLAPDLDFADAGVSKAGVQMADLQVAGLQMAGYKWPVTNGRLQMIDNVALRRSI